MSITVEKNQGIRLQLASAVPTPLHQTREAGGYYKVRSYHGGGEFFQPENAQVILQCLGEFLPRAVERPGSDGRMEIFYQHLVNGQDVSSRTAPLDSGVNVPKAEITRLEAAIAQLKAKENDPGTDPTKREIIRAFRLPSPQKDPELYRLYGSGGNRRLLVLWGVEKEAGSSLSPQEALQRVPQSNSSIPWWYWLLLALLLLLLLGWWWSAQQPAGAVRGLIPGNGSPTHILVLEPGRSGDDSTKGASPDSGAAKSSSGRLAAGTQLTEASPKAGMPSATVPGTPADPKHDDPNSPAGSNGSPQTPNALTSRRSTTLPDDPKQQPKPEDTPKSDDPKKSAVSPPGTTPADMPAASTANAEPKKTEPAKPGEPPPATKSDNTTPPVPAALPLSAEIVNARTSAAPKNGKVEMQLSMLARDSDGKAITISKVESWSVDGKTQNDDAGHPVTTNGLPVNLTEGAHRVRVTGTAADGRKVSAEADVNVDIAVRQESTVRVKQLVKP